MLRRDKPEEWKCQPYNWLPSDLEIHEMVVGAFSLALGSFISSCVACWVMNGGYSKIYFDPAEHGYVWLVLQLPLIFIWQVDIHSPFFAFYLVCCIQKVYRVHGCIQMYSPYCRITLRTGVTVSSIGPFSTRISISFITRTSNPQLFPPPPYIQWNSPSFNSSTSHPCLSSPFIGV